jgi:hypothetical protein
MSSGQPSATLREAPEHELTGVRRRGIEGVHEQVADVSCGQSLPLGVGTAPERQRMLLVGNALPVGSLDAVQSLASIGANE